MGNQWHAYVTEQDRKSLNLLNKGIYHLKSRLLGSHHEFTIWKLHFWVWILNGKFKVAAKNNIIDIFGITFKS